MKKKPITIFQQLLCSSFVICLLQLFSWMVRRIEKETCEDRLPFIHSKVHEKSVLRTLTRSRIKIRVSWNNNEKSTTHVLSLLLICFEAETSYLVKQKIYSNFFLKVKNKVNVFYRKREVNPKTFLFMLLN